MALKILHPQTRSEAHADARTRAWLEARIAAAIRHPGVVYVYDLDEERHLLSMELCAGGALKERLAKGALDPAEALTRTDALFGTLEAVHRRGVVHGDLKPANLLYRDRGDDADLVLGDFGVARLTHEERAPGEQAADHAIRARAARGTLAYMAPEQRLGELEPAADLYAAGVIAVEMLCGTRALDPWLGDRGGLIRGTAGWDERLPERVTSALGAGAPALVQLLRALLARTPAERPAPAEARQRLARLLPK